MRALAFSVSLVTLAAACAPGAIAPPASSEPDRFATVTWTFDGDRVGGLPEGATAFSGTWAVRAEDGSPSPPNALCQTASAEFPAIQLSSDVHRDVAMTVRFKPISGRTDQAGGVLLRIQDANNYYIVRANALESNVVIFKYVAGSRTEVRQGRAVTRSGVWQELRGEVEGTMLRGYLGGALVVEATDTTFREGRAGVWTKADSVTCFDDAVLTPVGGR